MSDNLVQLSKRADPYEEFARLFSEDGVFDEAGSRAQGRAAIAEHLRRIHAAQGNVDANVHFATNPRIELSGDEGTGNWKALVPVLTSKGDLLWKSGMYFERYVRTSEGWKFREIVGRVAISTHVWEYPNKTP